MQGKNRTFHKHADFRQIATIVLLAILTLAFLWHRQGAAVVVGFVLMLLTVLATERLIHTTYTFTSDGFLVIDRGRLSKKLCIEVDTIHRLRGIKGMLLVPRHMVIEYGAGHSLTVMPDNEEAFIAELKRRRLHQNEQYK